MTAPVDKNLSCQPLKKLPTVHIQSALLVVAVACAALSLFPHLGWASEVSLRSIVCASVSVQILHSMKENKGGDAIFTQIMRLASVVVGLAGFAANMNGLVMASLAIEMAFQALEAGRGIHQKNPGKVLSHLGFIVLDSIALGALFMGGWQSIAIAAAINSFAMFAFAAKAIAVGVKKNDLNAAFDGACHIALGGLGIAGSIRLIELTRKGKSTYLNTATNQ